MRVLNLFVVRYLNRSYGFLSLHKYLLGFFVYKIQTVNVYIFLRCYSIFLNRLREHMNNTLMKKIKFIFKHSTTP